MQWDRHIAAATAAALVLTALLTACGKTEKENASEEALSASEAIEEYTTGVYDWTQRRYSAKGEGKRSSSSVPYAYEEPDGYYQTSDSDKVTDGVRRTVYGIKLTGLRDTEMMTNINAVISEAQTALKNDVSWVDTETTLELCSSLEGAAEVEPVNYSAADVTVFGHVLSIHILYLHIYNVNDADGNHLADETVDEGRLLMNFDLRTGKVITLPELFYEDVDYISLLTGYMNKVGAEVGYSFDTAIDGLPADYDVYCLSGTGLVVGLTAGNPFIENGEEKWFSVSLADLIDSMDIDPTETSLYFNDEVTVRKLAFRVKDIAFTETEVVDLFSDKTVSLPLVSGIASADTINQALLSWYQTITDPANYSAEALAAGGSISAETQAPCGLVNITVFIYSAAQGEYITLARCYDAGSGKQLKVGDLLTHQAALRYGSGVSGAVSFRIGNDFLIGIPEQDGVPEYLLTEEGDMDMSRFE